MTDRGEWKFNMPDQEIVLQASNLNKSFGALQAVSGVSLAVEAGVHSIIGPNGAGKTTLFNLLTGFLKPTSGRIFYKGKEISGLPPHRISQLGIARSFQIMSFFPGLTVRENIRVAAQSRGKAAYKCWVSPKSLHQAEERTQELLELLGFSELSHLKAEHLSYGMQRNLDLGISLATNPNILLLDEPTAGMDREDASRTIGLISEFSRNIPVVLIEHNIDMVLSCSDMITVLHQGEVIAEGSPSQIQQDNKVQEAYLGVY